MQSWKGVLLGGLVASAAMFAPSSTLALRHKIEMGSDARLGFSWMHQVTRDNDRVSYTGEPYMTWSGCLNADVNGSIYDFAPSLLTGTARPDNNLGYTGHWSLKITGGRLDASVPHDALMGSLTYELWEDENELYDSGAFYFFNRRPAGNANSPSLDGIALFNRNQLEMSRADLAIAVDLPPAVDFEATPTPEPASMALLGTALVGGWLARRRRFELRA